MKYRQLVFITKSPKWKLDDKTKEVGRRGIEASREQLALHKPDDKNDTEEEVHP